MLIQFLDLRVRVSALGTSIQGPNIALFVPAI